MNVVCCNRISRTLSYLKLSWLVTKLGMWVCIYLFIGCTTIPGVFPFLQNSTPQTWCISIFFKELYSAIQPQLITINPRYPNSTRGEAMGKSHFLKLGRRHGSMFSMKQCQENIFNKQYFCRHTKVNPPKVSTSAPEGEITVFNFTSPSFPRKFHGRRCQYFLYDHNLEVSLGKPQPQYAPK